MKETLTTVTCVFVFAITMAFVAAYRMSAPKKKRTHLRIVKRD